MKYKMIQSIVYLGVLSFLMASNPTILQAQNKGNPLADNQLQILNTLNAPNLVSGKLATIVQLKEGSYTLEQILKSVTVQAGLTLSYSKEIVPINKKIQIGHLKTSAKKVLDKILKKTSIYFKVSSSDHLILFKKPSAKARPSQETVSGTVTDATTDETLPGVNILVKGTTTGTSTNKNGSYKLTVSSLKDTLIFSYIGYQQKEVPIQGRSQINVALTQKTLSGEEMVVVGYGTQQRADLTSSITTVDVEKTLESRPITDLASGLQGVVPGLTITTNTGEIGESANITLRGIQGSLNASGAHPLILVDGVEVPSLNMINPNDIETISVLKDAASTAIYGSEAAWGAILIKTKGGKKNTAFKVDYSNNFSIATPTTNLEVAPAVEGIKMAFSALQDANPSEKSFQRVGMWFDQLAIKKMKEWQQKYGDKNLSDEMVKGRDFEYRDGKLFFYRTWDAADKFMKKWTPMQKHNLKFSGGSENTSYNLGMGYLKQYGVLDFTTDTWARYNVNLGINSTINNWLDVRGKFKLARTDRVEPYAGYSDTYPTWYYLYRWQRTYPYGTYKGKPFRSAVTDVKQANLSDNTETFTRVSIGATANIAKGLTIDTDLTYNNRDIHTHNTGTVLEGYNFWAGGEDLNYQAYSSPSFNNVNYSSDWDKRLNLRAMATYQQDIEDHSVKILAGAESEIHKFQGQYSERQGLLDPNKGEIDLATGDQYVDGYHGEEATMGFFGRVNYSYKDRYLLQVNGRLDGSSHFPSNNRWGFFPSVSAGWAMSEEPFMKSAQPILSFLKIRGSYGSVGNAAVGSYPFLSIMGAYGSDWLINDNESQTTFGTPGPVSPTLTWEQVTTIDFGLDARFFENEMTLKFDWYKRTTSGMLSGGITLPATFGAAPPLRNYGELQTTGWEVKVGWHHNFSDNTYLNITGNLTNFTEEITKFSNTIKTLPDPTYVNDSFYTGLTLGNIWGYVTDRLFQRSDFKQDPNGNLLKDENGEPILKEGIPTQEIFESSGFSFGPGDVKYKDLNGDGEINYGENTVENPGDQKIIGNTTPKFQYGLRLSGGWKSFDFSVFIQGVGSREFWADGPVFTPGYRPYEAWYAHQLDYWTPQNKDAFYPRPTNHNQSSYIRNYLPQTRYLLDMSYMRLKNVTIGYTLPASVLSKTPIDKFRVYISGRNLFEFENLYLPVDPETSYSSGSARNSFGRIYPYQRTLSIGLNMTF